MLKHFIYAALISSTMFAAAAIPAQAAISSADCNYARMQQPTGANSGSSFNQNAQLLRQCSDKGL